MKISKVANATARRIFALCQTDGRIDEARLTKAIRRLADEKPRDYRGILAALRRLVRLDLERRRVTVESAVELDPASQMRVQSSLAQKYGDDLSFDYRVNPDLIGGLKVRVGNDVWDGSVKGRLDRLSQVF